MNTTGKKYIQTINHLKWGTILYDFPVKSTSRVRKYLPDTF